MKTITCYKASRIAVQSTVNLKWLLSDTLITRKLVDLDFVSTLNIISVRNQV